MENTFYITTAIAYASRKPHVGNDYEIIFTDSIARYNRLCGKDVFMLTGTDEHGQKIEEEATKKGMTPQEYVDAVSGAIRENYRMLNISNDGFIRTTDKHHEEVVSKIFTKLYEQGDIYKSEYEGLYCVPCEAFYTETQLKDGCCPDCGRPVEKTKEEAYFFRMSKYQDKLLKYIEEHPDFIVPESRKKEMINNFLKPGLQDLCVSRTAFKWGVPVTFDPKHVVYVWIDALTNYITAIGYDPDGSSEQFKKYWPADVHIIGKDILRFHTIYWPIILMALGLEMPKQIFGHPWLLYGTDKMSKSVGNVMYSSDLARHFGVDGVRYYLLSEMPYAQDGSITYETLIGKYNSDLANTIGNLVNRTVAMVHKYFDGTIPAPADGTEFDESLKESVLTSVQSLCRNMDKFRVADACDDLLDIAKRSNKYIDETAPWSLAKNESDRGKLATVMYNLTEAIRILAVVMQPFMPSSAEKIFEEIGATDQTLESATAFGVTKPGVKVGVAQPLFARIDEAKKYGELIAEAEARKPKKEEKKPAEGVTDLITIDDFSKVELRVAQIKSCEPVAKSDKLLCLQLDDGNGTRQVVSGIAKWYRPEELIGKKVVVVANLKPAKLRGVESNGMILAADAGAEDVKVLFVDDSVPSGAKVR